MARPNKVWYRAQTGWWMVKIDGKQEKLIQGPKDEEHRQLAEEKFIEIRRLNRRSPLTSAPASPPRTRPASLLSSSA
jgi:hypothetical protein